MGASVLPTQHFFSLAPYAILPIILFYSLRVISPLHDVILNEKLPDEELASFPPRPRYHPPRVGAYTPYCARACLDSSPQLLYPSPQDIKINAADIWPTALSDTEKTVWHTRGQRGYEGTHPLSALELWRSFEPGGACAFARVFEGLGGSSSKQLHFLFVGGEMAMGRGCDTASFHRVCPWPRILEEWMTSERPQWRAHVSTTDVAGLDVLPFAAIESVDVFVLDVGSDQALMGPENATADMDALVWRLLNARNPMLRMAPETMPPAILVVQTLRTCFSGTNECKQACPHSDHIYTTENQFISCGAWWRTADFSALVARHYGLPTSSLRNALWPKMTAPAPNLAKVWSGRVAQELTADIVKYALLRLEAAHKAMPPSASVCLHTCSFPPPYLRFADVSVTRPECFDSFTAASCEDSCAINTTPQAPTESQVTSWAPFPLAQPSPPYLSSMASLAAAFAPSGVYKPAPVWRSHHWVAGTQGVYPLTLSDIRRSFIPGRSCSFANFFEVMEGGRELTMVVLGGSMTAGAECNGELCTWAAQVGQWIGVARPQWRLKFANWASGGLDAAAWAARSDFPLADAYIVDVAVNAQGLALASVAKNMDALLWRLAHLVAPSLDGAPPAVLLVETFRTCGRDKAEPGSVWQGDYHDCSGHCSATDQVFSGTNLHRTGICGDWWRIADAEAIVGRHYGVPIVMYRDAVWPLLNAPGPDVRLAWDGLSHPSRVTHELVADLVKYALLRLEAERAVNAAGFSCFPDTHIAPYTGFASVGAGCAFRARGPLTQVGTIGGNANANTSKLATFSGGWRYFEDAPRKPGWIVEEGNPGSIRFYVHLSASAPRLEVTFLRSYASVGTAGLKLTIGPCSWDWELEGRSIDRYSLPYVLGIGGPAELAFVSERYRNVPFPFSSNPACVPADGVLYSVDVVFPYGSQPVQEGGGALKFKLIAISSC